MNEVLLYVIDLGVVSALILLLLRLKVAEEHIAILRETKRSAPEPNFAIRSGATCTAHEVPAAIADLPRVLALHRIRNDEVKDAIAQLSPAQLDGFRKLVLSGGLLSRHLRAQLQRSGYPSDPDDVHNLIEALLDVNLVYRDGEGRIHIKPDVQGVGEGMLL
jgi:hypothetical protein